MAERVVLENLKAQERTGMGSGWGLACLLAVSAVLRAYLALSGGQFYYADEIRFRQSQEAARLALAGEFAKAWGHETLSIEHVGYKLVAAASEYARQKAGFGLEFTFLVFSQFSTLNILLVWLIARNLGASSRESLLAAAFMGATASMLFFSRHLVPYDVTLSLCLAALAILTRDRAGTVSLFVAGFLASASFLAYNGTWFLIPVAVLVYAMRRKQTFGELAGGLGSIGAGGVTAVLLLGFTGRSFSSALAEYAAFSQTITMGDYSDGWIFPFEYLWHCDGLVLVIQVISVAALALVVATGRASPRERIYLVCVLLAYVLLAGSSAILHKFVVYGRTARMLTPFLCLAAGWWCSRSVVPAGTGFVRQGLFWSVLVMLAVANAIPSVNLVFKDRFEKSLEAKYGDFRTMKPFDIRETGEKEPLASGCPEFVIAAQASPTSYLPYRYESTSREFRDYMATQRHEFVFYKCRYDLPCLEIDFIDAKVPPDVQIRGLGEEMEYAGKLARWTMGPSSEIRFWEQGGRTVEMRYELLGLVFDRLEVEVYVNGNRMDSFILSRMDGKPGDHAGVLRFEPAAGLNVVEFRYSDWNGRNGYVIEADKRAFAAAFRRLAFTTVPGGCEAK